MYLYCDETPKRKLMTKTVYFDKNTFSNPFKMNIVKRDQ